MKQAIQFKTPTKDSNPGFEETLIDREIGNSEVVSKLYQIGKGCLKFVLMM
jgi:hypothetical protein